MLTPPSPLRCSRTLTKPGRPDFFTTPSRPMYCCSSSAASFLNLTFTVSPATNGRSSSASSFSSSCRGSAATWPLCAGPLSSAAGASAGLCGGGVESSDVTAAGSAAAASGAAAGAGVVSSGAVGPGTELEVLLAGLCAAAASRISSKSGKARQNASLLLFQAKDAAASLRLSACELAGITAPVVSSSSSMKESNAFMRDESHHAGCQLSG
mmetsp:Transcript_56919/g.132686  ORF Transcript_56919/g.132686 Transcript_56919/m.132686 type:complete len:211 (+) Transcript_56919:9-641(+)